MASDTGKGMVKPVKAGVEQTGYNYVDFDKVSDIIRDGNELYFSQKDGSGRKNFSYVKDPQALLPDLERFQKILKQKGEPNMFKQMGSDLKAFIAEHKSVIYWIALLFLADYFLFNGAFRERLNAVMNKILGKVESAVEGKPLTVVAAEKKS